MQGIWTWLARLCLLACFAGPASFGPAAFGKTEAPEPYKVMSVADVAKHLHDKGVYVFDANGETVYADGHVPGATRIDFDAVTADKLPKDKLAKLIFYCKNPR